MLVKITCSIARDISWKGDIFILACKFTAKVGIDRALLGTDTCNLTRVCSQDPVTIIVPGDNVKRICDDGAAHAAGRLEPRFPKAFWLGLFEETRLKQKLRAPA